MIRKDDDNDKYSFDANKIENRFLRGILTVLGTILLGLGILGIILPLLPTTPFLLLAAACYSRSSKRFYNWLLGNKWFGMYIKNYREGKGVPLSAKILSVSFLWLTILFSTLFLVENLYVRIILLLVATGVTIHIFSVRTMKKSVVTAKSVNNPPG